MNISAEFSISNSARNMFNNAVSNIGVDMSPHKAEEKAEAVLKRPEEQNRREIADAVASSPKQVTPKTSNSTFEVVV